MARQAPLSMGVSRQEYWSGLPFPSPGDRPDPGIEPGCLRSPALAGEFFTTSASREVAINLLKLIVDSAGIAHHRGRKRPKARKKPLGWGHWFSPLWERIAQTVQRGHCRHKALSPSAFQNLNWHTALFVNARQKSCGLLINSTWSRSAPLPRRLPRGSLRRLRA